MKKRLLSLLLLVAMVVTALPLVILPASATASEPSFTEEDYNALYKQEGLVYAFDVFTLNEHWAEARGEHPAFPVAPHENDAYWYDADKDGVEDEGEIVDLTTDAGRYTAAYGLLHMPNTWTWNDVTGSYATYDEAVLAAYNYANGTTLTELPQDVTMPAAGFAVTSATTIPGVASDKKTGTLAVQAYDLSDAYKAAAKEWHTAEAAWIASFAWAKSAGRLESAYYYTANRAKAVYASPKEHSVFTVADGYLQFRTDYNAGMNGGLLPRGFAEGTTASSVQLVSGVSTGVTTSNSYVPFIIHDFRVVMSRDSENGVFKLQKFGNTKFTLAEGQSFPTDKSLPLGTPFTYTQVHNVSGAAGTHTLNAYDQNSQLLSLVGTYGSTTLQNSQNYIGYSNAQKIKLYAYRYYADELTLSDVAQNHFADLCKWFRLDLTPLALLSDSDMPALYAAVANFNFDSDRDEVAAAVLSAAQAKAAEKYSSLDAAIVAVAVQYGLDLSPLTVQPKGMLSRTYAFLREGYHGSSDVRADYEAALALDLASSMTAEDYNALYVQDGMTVALDYFASNKYWQGAGAPTSAIDDAYLRLWVGRAGDLYLKADEGTVANGALTISASAYHNLGYSNNAVNNGANGATIEYVVENKTPVGGQLLNLDDIRVYGTVSGSTFHITQVGQRDARLGALARPTAVAGELDVLNDTTLASFTMGGAMTYALSYKRPATTQSYYKYNYADHGNPVLPSAGQSSTSCFYVTHKLEGGELVQLTKNGAENPTAKVYAFNIPVYHEHTDGKLYIVGYIERFTESGKGHGVDAEHDYYNTAQGEISLRIDGATMFDYDDVMFPDSDQILGGTYLRHTYASERNVFAYRQYSRQLSDAELAQNHFADVAKFFRLNLVGFESLSDIDKAAVYAAVAEIDLATSTQTEAQNAVSAVITPKADEGYDAMKDGVTDPDLLAFIDKAKSWRLDITEVLATKRNMTSVYTTDFEGLSCEAAQAKLDEAYLDAYYYLSYNRFGEDEWNDMLIWCATHPYMTGADRVDLEPLMALPFEERVGILDLKAQYESATSVAAAQAIIDGYVEEKMAAYGIDGYADFDYSTLYVSRGLLLAADFFGTNAYWGGTMTAPVNPSENTAYWYDANEDGVEDEGEIYDLTTDAARYNGKWAVNKMPNSWTRERQTGVYATEAEARLAAYNLANGTSLTELPDGVTSPILAPDAVNGYPCYEVAPDDLSDVFKAAYKTWRTEDMAALNANIWYNIDKNSLNLFSYSKAGDSRAPTRVQGGPSTVSAFRVGEGFITLREDLISDAGLQTNANLATKYGAEAMSTQVIGTLNDKIAHNSSTAGNAASIFYNIRPMVKKSADGKSMSLVKITNFTASEALPTTAVALDGVKDMTYTLTGYGTDATDTFSLRFGQDAWIDVEGAYPGTLNGTTYLGYGTAFGGAKVYALRYYNVALTNAEIAQNHFADLAKFFRIDLTGFTQLSGTQKTALYAAVADMTFENTTRDAVQAEYDAVLAAGLEGTVIVADAEKNEAFLALAAIGKLDLAPIENLDASGREAIVDAMLAVFDPVYAVNGALVAIKYEEMTGELAILTFEGYQVRLDSGSVLANYAGVRAVYKVDLDKIEAICKDEGMEVGLSVNVTVGGTAAATLNFLFTWDSEAEELKVEGENKVGENDPVPADLVVEEIDGKKIGTFYYTVTYKGESFTEANLAKEFGYTYAIGIGADILAADYDRGYEFTVVSQNFGETVTASEVYGYFYNHGYAEDAVVKSVYDLLAAGD